MKTREERLTDLRENTRKRNKCHRDTVKAPFRIDTPELMNNPDCLEDYRKVQDLLSKEW